MKRTRRRPDPRRRSNVLVGAGWALRAARRLCCLAVCVAATARAQPASGEDTRAADDADAEATSAFLNGKDDFESGRYAEAQEQFQKAYALTNDPALLYNLGQTYRKMGRCAEARQAYEQFLQAAPGSPLAERAHRHLGTLESSCVAPAADAAERSPDAQPRIVAVPSASTSPTPSTAPASATQGSLIPVPPASASQRPAAFDSSGEADWRVWIWVATGTGLALAGTALGLEIYNQPRHAEWSAENKSLKQWPRAGETETDWLARQDENNRLSESIAAVDNTAIATGITGAVLVAASGVLFWLTAPDTSRPGRAAATASPMPGLSATIGDVTAPTVTLSGTF